MVVWTLDFDFGGCSILVGWMDDFGCVDVEFWLCGCWYFVCVDVRMWLFGRWILIGRMLYFGCENVGFWFGGR